MSKRFYHSSTIVRDHVYVFGGKDYVIFLNELWDFNLETGKFALVDNLGGFSPSPRGGHVAVVYRDSLIIFGGTYNEQLLYNDMYEYITCLLIVIRCYLFFLQF
jgi:hypothetical protein